MKPWFRNFRGFVMFSLTLYKVYTVGYSPVFSRHNFILQFIPKRAADMVDRMTFINNGLLPGHQWDRAVSTCIRVVTSVVCRTVAHHRSPPPNPSAHVCSQNPRDTNRAAPEDTCTLDTCSWSGRNIQGQGHTQVKEVRGHEVRLIPPGMWCEAWACVVFTC